MLRSVKERRNWQCLLLVLSIVFTLPQTAQAAITIASTSPLPAGSLGVPYTFQFSISGAAGGVVTWAAIGGSIPNLSLAPNGVLSGTPQTAGVFSITVQASDQQGQTATGSFLIVIGSAPVQITTTSLPATTVGASYFAAVSAVGGTGSLTWSLSGGSLPPGLTFSAGGSISGIPTTSGTYSFSVTVTDTFRTSDTRSLSIRVSPASTSDGGPQLTGTCSATPYVPGQVISIELVPNTDAPLRYVVVTPAWFTIQRNGSRVFATGTPPATGQFTLTVQATDQLSQSTIFSCGFVVGRVLTIAASCPTQTFSQGSPIAIPLAADGGSGTYTWSLTAPTGLRLAATNGSVNSVIADATAVGDLPFTVTLSDGTSGPPQTFSCTVKIVGGALGITGPPCPTAPIVAGSTLSISLKASGGLGTYAWTLQGPSWLKLSTSSGGSTTITGSAPPEGGKFSFTATLKDPVSGNVATYTCQVEVLPALSITGVLPSLLVGQNFTATLTASGGSGDYTWKVSGPPWIGIQPAGPSASLSGTPSSTDTFVCTVTLTDSAGSQPVTFDCSGKPGFATLTIAADASACPASPAILGQRFATIFRALGGNGLYRWTFETVEGPAFLASSGETTDTLRVSGVPDAAGTTRFSVRLEDTAGNTPATFSCSLRIAPPAIPAIQIVGLSLSGGLLQPVNASLQLAEPAPVRLEGVVQLTFTSSTTDGRDNRQVQFNSPPGGRTQSFIIPAGSSTIALGSIQPGTAAGTIRLEVTALTAGGANVLGDPHPSRDLIIPRLPPVLTDLTFESEVGNGFTITITGYTTTRDATTLSVNLTPRSGATLKTTSLTTTVSDAFSSFFTSDASTINGGTFTLRIPVTVNGNKNDIGAVTVKLTNTAGDSNPLTANR